MGTGKRGRPRKTGKDKTGVKHVTAPLDVLEKVEKAGLSFSAMSRFALYYSEAILEAGEIPEEFKRGKTSDEELRKLAKYHAEVKLCEIEEYMIKVNEEERTNATSFASSLIELMTKHSRRIKFGSQPCEDDLRKLIRKDPTGKVSFSEVMRFLTYTDDGRNLKENALPHKNRQEIEAYVTTLLLDPIGMVSTAKIVSVVE